MTTRLTTSPARRYATITRTHTRDAEALETLSHLVYGTSHAAPNGTLLADHFRRHVEKFPEGQFVARVGGQVIGLTASMRIPFDPARPFIESWHTTISDGWLDRHDPDAEWMYGVESCVHPDFQGHGVGGRLMQARFDLARALNLRGMVAGSDLVGYSAVADHASPEDYVRGVVEGRYFDNNLTKQVKKGFRPVGLIPNYLPYESSLGWGAVIVWDNPAYDPAHPVGKSSLPPRRYRLCLRE